ncbi:MAG: molybdopterin molybdotransferase MoeA [Chitinophagales bacterium]|nr:molybdopterin molybdotransferase MoeA [Chitinophagales bacterium]
MIGINEAKRMILENCDQVKVDWLPLINASSYVLAEAVYSPIDTPPFDQSAMDGYAFSYDQWDKNSKLLVTGEVQAGSFSDTKVHPNQAIRIFTGAPLPPGADTVVMQEKISIHENHITIKDEQLSKGSNVRLCGSQTKKNVMALPGNHFLTPASISFLAGIGVDKVKVYQNPDISIIVTGKELINADHKIGEGKVYESNSFALRAVLKQFNIEPVSVEMAEDNEKETINAINKQMTSDIVLLTGGVSVGDYDFVTTALEKCSVKKIFHKVRQKPGKPLYFGKKDHTLVFGLPGNPASALTCFYEYVSIAISNFIKRDIFRRQRIPLANEYVKKAGITYFMKGKVMDGEALILKHQESYKMNSFAEADCIIELEEDKEYFQKGDPVNILMI